MKRLTVVALGLLAGCIVRLGPGPDSFPPAHTADGARVSLALASTGIDGEMLEVRDTGLVILTRDRVALVPFDAISSGVFEHSTVSVGFHRKPLPEELTTIQLLSRYPQGIPPETLKRLLASKKQDSIAVVR